MLKNEKGFTIIEVCFVLFWLFIVVVGGTGWVLNIIAIAGSSFDPLTAIVVLRCIGIIVAPLGAVMGLFF